MAHHMGREDAYSRFTNTVVHKMSQQAENVVYATMSAIYWSRSRT